MDSEQLYLHSQVQDNVASLEDQSQQIAGEDFMISCYLLVFFPQCLCLIIIKFLIPFLFLMLAMFFGLFVKNIPLNLSCYLSTLPHYFLVFSFRRQQVWPRTLQSGIVGRACG